MFHHPLPEAPNKKTCYQPTLHVLLGYTEPDTSDKKPPLLLKKRKRDAPVETTMLHFFKPVREPHKRQDVETHIADKQSAVAEAPIVVSYREDGSGRGACFDHLALQTITKRKTLIAKPSLQPLTSFEEHNKTITYHLPITEESTPPILSDIDDIPGLLYIPGVASTVYKTPAYEARKRYEFELIRKAKNRGQPILGICGGSWVIWEQYQGHVTPVSEHNCRSGMPRVSETTGKIGYNLLIHDIEVTSSALLLQAALDLKTKTISKLPVNSVHSFAPDRRFVPSGLRISALSVQNDLIAPASAHPHGHAEAASAGAGKVRMKPEEDTIEAFESEHSAPILGIQWHPEAFTNLSAKGYYAEHQQHLIKYMAKAGQTFLQRQSLNTELLLRSRPASMKPFPLKRTELISAFNQVIKTNKKGIIQFSIFKLRAGETLRHQQEAITEIREKERYLEEKGYRSR